MHTTRTPSTKKIAFIVSFPPKSDSPPIVVMLRVVLLQGRDRTACHRRIVLRTWISVFMRRILNSVKRIIGAEGWGTYTCDSTHSLIMDTGWRA